MQRGPKRLFFLQPVELVCYSSRFPFGKKCDTMCYRPPASHDFNKTPAKVSQEWSKDIFSAKDGLQCRSLFVFRCKNAAAAATTLVSSAAAIVHKLRGASSASRSSPVVFKRHFAAVSLCFWHNNMFSCLSTKTSWRHFRLELFEMGWETSNLNNPAALQGCRIKWRCLDSADFPCVRLPAE